MLIDLTDPATAAAAQRSGDFVLANGIDGADTLLGPVRWSMWRRPGRGPAGTRGVNA